MVLAAETLKVEKRANERAAREITNRPVKKAFEIYVPWRTKYLDGKQTCNALEDQEYFENNLTNEMVEILT